MLIAITPGRALRWAPNWKCSDEAVLFDSGSGDYWLLSEDGRTVMQWLQGQAGIERDELVARLARLASDGNALLRNLAKAGLLTAMKDGVATRWPSGIDADD